MVNPQSDPLCAAARFGGTASGVWRSCPAPRPWVLQQWLARCREAAARCGGRDGCQSASAPADVSDRVGSTPAALERSTGHPCSGPVHGCPRLTLSGSEVRDTHAPDQFMGVLGLLFRQKTGCPALSPSCTLAGCRQRVERRPAGSWPYRIGWRCRRRRRAWRGVTRPQRVVRAVWAGSALAPARRASRSDRGWCGSRPRAAVSGASLVASSAALVAELANLFDPEEAILMGRGSRCGRRFPWRPRRQRDSSR